jgi:hypothetical protein
VSVGDGGGNSLLYRLAILSACMQPLKIARPKKGKDSIADSGRFDMDRSAGRNYVSHYQGKPGNDTLFAQEQLKIV